MRDTLRDLTSQTNRLAKTIERIEVKQRWSIFAHPTKFFFFSFMNGLFIAIGSTFGVALILLIFHYLGYLPIIGELANQAREVIQNTR